MDRAQLARIFRRERARFARRFPWIADVTLCVVDAPCQPGRRRCAVRDLAWAQWSTPWNGGTVSILARALHLPRRNVAGLIRHELGHLADPVEHRAGAEQRADDIAEMVCGRKIRYEGRHQIQTTGRGVYPRPRNLHS